VGSGDGDLSGGMVFDAARVRLIELHEVTHQREPLLKEEAR